MTDGWSAMSDIGRFGLETAADVVERILELSRRATTIRFPGLGAVDGDDSARRIRADAERLVDLYAEWTRSLLDTALDAAAPAGRGAASLVIGPVAAGAAADGTAWLHLLDTPGPAACRVGAGDLAGCGGAVIPAGAVTCTPAVVDANAADRSHSIHVRVEVPAGTPSGPYRGYLLVDRMPEVALPIRVDVAEPEA